jgi:hypothetical protein
MDMTMTTSAGASATSQPNEATSPCKISVSNLLREMCPKLEYVLINKRVQMLWNWNTVNSCKRTLMHLISSPADR